MIPHKILDHLIMLLFNNIDTQQERQIFGTYGRQYTSKVCSHCGKIGHVIDTCYRKHGFPPQFKFKNRKADYNNN